MILFYFYKIKNTFFFLKKYFIGYLLFLLIIFFLSTYVVNADTFIPTSKLQYYEGYEENFNTGSSSFHEDGYSYGSNITPPLSPGYSEHPYAISLIINGSYKAGNTYIFTATLFSTIKGSTFKFYYPNLLYMAWFARLDYQGEKVTCNFDMIIENVHFDITCSYQPTVDSNSAIISFVNHDWQNNGYLTYDDLGTFFKWDNINIQLYSDSSGAIIEQNQTIIEQNNKMNEELQKNTEEQKKTNDTLTDSDTSSATEEGSSFFNDFSTVDHGGIASIVTAPLTAINKMLDNSCTPLSATWKGKTISLPCGYVFWGKMDEIKSFLNVAIGGLLCYRIILKLYLLIEKLKNPDNDRVEVMKL